MKGFGYLIKYSDIIDKYVLIYLQVGNLNLILFY